MKLFKITTAGQLEVIECKDDKLLDTCYKEIGCDCIECPTSAILPGHLQMIVDESGWLKDEPQINVIASWFYSKLHKDYLIAGTAIIARRGLNQDGEEDLISLTDQDITFLKNLILS